jgi:hypothetical protein
VQESKTEIRLNTKPSCWVLSQLPLCYPVYGGSPPMRQEAHITRTMSLQATPAWWVERVLPMATVATRISTLGHGLPLLPTLAEHQCVGSSVPWRPGKTGDSAVERLFRGKTLVGLAGVDRWSAQGSAADTWAQNARLRSCRALRACRYDSWGAIGDHARIFLPSLPKRCR